MNSEEIRDELTEAPPVELNEPLINIRRLDETKIWKDKVGKIKIISKAGKL